MFGKSTENLKIRNKYYIYNYNTYVTERPINNVNMNQPTRQFEQYIQL